ncbi:MAG: ring-cleaving dioxygenase, partial [Chloroflexi bacterium]
MELTGIHHVTAVSGNARANVDFYTQLLGLRLVKKTVNQDVISTYHLFFADGVATPGTDMTFFEWPDVPPHQIGAGDVTTTAFVVPDWPALEWWVQRFDELGVARGEIEEWTGRPTLPFTDPEGQRLELVVGERDGASPWSKSPIPVEMAVHGFAALHLAVPSIELSSTFLREVLGFRQTRTYESPDGSRRFAVFETGDGGLGTEVHLEEQRGRRRAQVGVGGVHHVAFRTPNEEEHRHWRERLAGAGVGVTPVIDRYYFKSVYFREPGGVL